MSKHSIISIIEVLAAMFLGGIGVILYPQRGFSIEFAYKWVASLGFVTLFLAMEGQFMTRTITNLAGYRKKNSAHKLIYAITYLFVIFITVLCGFWASSVWSRTNISSRTLIILSAEFGLVHILLLFFISMLRHKEADKSKAEDRSRSVEDDEFKIAGINTGINGIILDSCDIDTEDNDWQGFISDRRIAFKQEKVEVVNVCEVNAYDKSNVN